MSGMNFLGLPSQCPGCGADTLRPNDFCKHPKGCGLAHDHFAHADRVEKENETIALMTAGMDEEGTYVIVNKKTGEFLGATFTEGGAYALLWTFDDGSAADYEVLPARPPEEEDPNG